MAFHIEGALATSPECLGMYEHQCVQALYCAFSGLLPSLCAIRIEIYLFLATSVVATDAESIVFYQALCCRGLFILFFSACHSLIVKFAILWLLKLDLFMLLKCLWEACMNAHHAKFVNGSLVHFTASV